MANAYHDQMSGSDLHANKIDSTTGTELTPASQAIYDARWEAKAWISVGSSAANTYQATGTNDHLAIQNAINAAFAAGGGTVLCNGLSFAIAGRITPKATVRVLGLGKGITKLTGGVAFDYTFYNSTAINDFWLEDLTIDCQNANHASGMALQYATDCGLQRVRFKNVASGGWMLKLGVSDGLNDGIANLNNRFIDCDFDTHAGTLEMLLLFNCKNTWVVRPKFVNKTANGNALGLWQKCYGTIIIQPVFKDVQAGGLYYSITVENTLIDKPYFENVGSAITGANVSDNGQFGLTQAQGLHISDPIIVGGANSTNGVGIQLGAVNNVTVTNPQIEKMQIGIKIDKGNTPANAAATNWTITNPQIRNCNPSNNVHLLHPGIFFNAIGGSLYGKIVLGAIYDDQGTPTQRYPIVFDGAFTWNCIQILSCRLSADTVNNGTSIKLGDGASLGANVLIRDNQDYSGTSPAQGGAP